MMKKENLIGVGVFLVVVGGLVAFFWKDIKSFFAKKTTGSGAGASTTSDPLLKMGSKGQYVTTLQTRLNKADTSKTALTVDGDFGPLTEQRLNCLLDTSPSPRDRG